jgi:hypothetical protein
MRGSVLLLAAAVALVPAAAGCRRQAAPGGSPEGEGPPTGPVSARCVEEYSPDTLRNRAFAFDGTVVSIELRQDPNLEVQGGEDSREPWVTFSVHHWYRGGSGDEVGVWIENLNMETSVGTITAEPGTRLLVAGEPRWGGAPFDDAIAWACGFTQPYSPEVAAKWQATLGQ